MALLTMLPCRDSVDFDMIKSHTTFTKAPSASEKTGKEACTPFCACSCCSVVRIVTSHQQVVLSSVQPVIKAYGESPVPAVLDQILTIWQPPRIS